MNSKIKEHSTKHAEDSVVIDAKERQSEANLGINNNSIYEAEDGLSREEANKLINFEARRTLVRIWQSYHERQDHSAKIPAFIKESINAGVSDADVRHYLHNHYFKPDSPFNWKDTQKICDQVRLKSKGILTQPRATDPHSYRRPTDAEDIIECPAETMEEAVQPGAILSLSTSDYLPVTYSPNNDETAELAAMTLRDNAKQQLAQIRSIESGITYLNRIKSIETWAKAEKKDAELMNLAASQKIRTQRILGKMLQDDGSIKRGNTPGSNGRETVKLKPTTLQTYGLTKDQSSLFQKIANIPDERFDHFMEETERSNAELTTAAVVRFSKSLKGKVGREPIIDDMLRIAQRLRNKYNSAQIAELVRLLHPGKS